MWFTIHASFATPVAETLLKPGPGWVITQQGFERMQIPTYILISEMI